MKHMFINLFRHMEWADLKIGSTLESYGKKDEKRIADALRLYAHTVAAERIWLGRIEGEGDYAAPLFPDWDITLCNEESKRTLAKFGKLLRQDQDFGRPITYRNSTGAEFRTSVADILTHVFMHGSYHRGQINMRLRTSGLEPVPLDYIVFVREATPR